MPHAPSDIPAGTTSAAPASATSGAVRATTGAPASAAEPATVAFGSGAACRDCGAPLAGDQRYCLSCGVRVADPRLPFAELVAGAPATAALATPASPARGGLGRQLERIGGPMGAAAVVLVALGIGFLLGQGGSGHGAPTVIQRPPVVNVTGGGTAAPSTSGSGGDTSGGKGGKAKGASGGSGNTKGVPKANTHDTTGGDLNKLKQQPADTATGGTAPKKDNKPAGGGSAVTSIG